MAVRRASVEIGDLTSGPHTIAVHAQNRYSSTNDNPYGFTLLGQAACSFVVDAPDAHTPTPPPLLAIPAPIQTMLIMLLVAAFAVGCVLIYFRKRRRHAFVRNKTLLVASLNFAGAYLMGYREILKCQE